MAEPLTTEVFGPGFTQTATHFTIAKADLPGLSAAIDNRAEQLFVGIILKAKSVLTSERQDSNPEQSITFGDTSDFLVNRNNQQYRQTTLPVQLEKPDANAVIDPDDY